jgi:uncharacterized membrane protein
MTAVGQPSAERFRTALWTWPVGAGLLGAVLATALARVRPQSGSWLGSLWPGDVPAARSMLQVVATADMTAITLTFSVTVVALQLASQQFSPRLLREFARDPVTKAVLATLSGAFVFATTTIAHLHEDEPVPTLAVAVGFALGIASLGAILAFITHILKAVRVDTMMRIVHDETDVAIERFYPPYGDPSVRSDEGLHLGEGRQLSADTSGFVQRTDVQRLVADAAQADAVVRVEARAGDHVVRGTPIATVWAGSRAEPSTSPRLEDRVRDAITIGYERTIDQDTGFGFRQLEDIAVKAMSPSVNDPVTATHAVGHMADLLVRLVGCRLGATLHEDDSGTGRVVVPDRDLRYYLDLACGQLRRFSASEPTVLIALLRMLRDVGLACRDDEQRTEVRRAADLVVGELDAVQPVDRAEVEAMRARVDWALAGDARAAYGDRVGETRSI